MCDELAFAAVSYRGYYSAYTFAFTDEAGAETDVTGWGFVLRLYADDGTGRPTTGGPAKTFSVAGGQVTVGTTDGLITVAFPAAESLALAAGQYQAEAQATDSLGLPRLIARGPWEHQYTGLGAT